jgi:hypothetical protein
MTGPSAGSLDAEVVSFLDAFRDVVLFCRDGSERPIGYPMRTTACGESGLTFTTYRKSAKVVNIERDPRVCVFAADQGQGEIRWVSVAGRARIVSPTEEEIDATFGPSAGDGRVPAGMGDFVKQRLREGKRILLQVEDLEASGVRRGVLE